MDEVSPWEWKKIAGKYKGCLIGQKNDFIYSDAGEDALLYWSGAWYSPKKEFAPLKNKLVAEERELIETLIVFYSDVSLSVNPYDLDLMIVPILLSRRTSYEKNVLKWCKELWKRANSLEDLLRMDFSIVGTSYQLTQLKESLFDLKSEVIPKLGENLDPQELRLTLMKCKHVGPKVADAYLLFTGIDVSATPVDIHLIRMVRRLSLVKYSKLPSKEYCKRFTCDDCPISHNCLRAIFTRKFERLSGWIQTVFYLHDKLYCYKSMCDKCSLKSYCVQG